MLSRKIVKSFLNATSASSSSKTREDADMKAPASFYSYRDFFGPVKEASSKSLASSREALNCNSPTGVDIIQKTRETHEKDEVTMKHSKGVEDGLRHVIQLDKIKQRRDAARMKYQEILLKRSSGNSVSSSSSNTTTSTNSNKNSKINSSKKKKKVKKAKLLREISEIDEEDGSSLIEAEAMFPSSVGSNSESLRPMSPLSVDMKSIDGNGKMLRPFSPLPGDMTIETRGKLLRPFSPMSVDAVPNSLSRPFSPMSIDSSASRPFTPYGKRKPHVKEYASEYNMLVCAVSKLLESNNTKNDPHDSGVIKFGSLKKITHMDVGVGFDIFVELRPGIITYYKKAPGGERNVEVTSIPLKCGQCSCRPTMNLKKAPFPLWDAVFEVAVKGSPTVFLMGGNTSERTEWMDAFEEALRMGRDKAGDQGEEMREDTNTEQDIRSAESMKSVKGRNADILLYLHVRGLIKGVCSKDEYLESLSILLDKKITIPIVWLSEYFEDSPPTIEGQDTPEEWERLANETLSLNGHLMKGTIDDTIGSIKSHLIDLDKCSCQNGITRSKIKESQAIFFARDILLSCDRVNCEEQSIYCSSKMLENEHLAFLTPSSEDIEPLKVSLKRLKLGKLNRDGVDSSDSSVEILDAYEISSDCDCTVEVTVRVPSIYRICSTDLLDRESWALMRTIHIQKFVLGSNGFQRMDRFVQFEIVP